VLCVSAVFWDMPHGSLVSVLLAVFLFGVPCDHDDGGSIFLMCVSIMLDCSASHSALVH
jgi:hypothetical protein